MGSVGVAWRPLAARRLIAYGVRGRASLKTSMAAAAWREMGGSGGRASPRNVAEAGAREGKNASAIGARKAYAP